MIIGGVIIISSSTSIRVSSSLSARIVIASSWPLRCHSTIACRVSVVEVKNKISICIKIVWKWDINGKMVGRSARPSSYPHHLLLKLFRQLEEWPCEESNKVKIRVRKKDGKTVVYELRLHLSALEIKSWQRWSIAQLNVSAHHWPPISNILCNELFVYCSNYHCTVA